MRAFQLSFLIVLACVSCGKKMDQQVREAVRTFENISLGRDDVEVENVQQMGGHVVAEVTVKTAVKLEKKEGKWVIEEVRIGDRRWERVDHILAVINEQRTETTRRQLDLISEGIKRYSRLHPKVPQVSKFEELIDSLTPRYLNRIVRIDAWSNPLLYRSLSAQTYDLRSAGGDGRVGTPDDLIAGSH